MSFGGPGATRPSVITASTPAYYLVSMHLRQRFWERLDFFPLAFFGTVCQQRAGPSGTAEAAQNTAETGR